MDDTARQDWVGRREVAQDRTGNPIAFSNVERVPSGIAPRLGENTDEILDEIGYAGAEIAGLHDDGVAAGPP